MELESILAELGIQYEETVHPPVYTVEQAQKIQLKIAGTGCKNLFLTDHHQKYLLVVLEEHKQADLKKIAKEAGTKRLSFASDKILQELLGLSPGCVSPFGLIHDREKKIELVMDASMVGKRLLFHPNVNTKTIAVWYEDLVRFVEFTGHEYVLFQTC